MYKRQTTPYKTTMKKNKSFVGETIEGKIRRIMNNKEPIKDSAPQVYTDRKDGVVPSLDIRTDKWEHAIDHTSNIEKSNTAKREKHIGEQTYDTMTKEQQDTFNKTHPDNKHAIIAKNKGESGA